MISFAFGAILGVIFTVLANDYKLEKRGYKIWDEVPDKR